MQLSSYIAGNWVSGAGSGAVLRDATTAEPIASASSEGLDFAAVLEHARAVGGVNLRRLSFHERAARLKALARFLSERKEELYRLSYATGATKSDSWIDIDGGIGTLFVYASKGMKELPDGHVYVDGPAEALAKSGGFLGQHICVPLEGAAIHINAFNFPVWGMLEKLAPALLAGMPAVIKPATATAYLTQLAFRLIIESGQLPEGAAQLICGGVGDLLEHLTCQDMIAFTGSASTARKLRTCPRVLERSVRFTAETDSLNSCILGPDAAPGSPEFDLFVQEVVREMTVKAGQKCTAIRKAIVPASRGAAVVEALRAGASGFLLKDATPEELVHAVRVVAAGQALLAPAVTSRLIESVLPRLVAPGSSLARQKNALDQLTERELEVLMLVARGQSNAEIGTSLSISDATVKTHVSHILTKLGVRDRVQVVIAAYELGLVARGT